MQKSIGQKLRECREERTWTQQELADRLNVTRQAVSNWERDKTLPDVYMIREIAAIFDMTLDEYMENTKKAEVEMPKMPGRLTIGTIIQVILYLLLGGITGHLEVEILMEMVIISVLCQGFMHLMFSSSVKTGNFAMMAGFSSKVEYRIEEVKRVLIQMDKHTSCSAFGTVLLLAMCPFMGERQGEIVSVCLLLAYSVDVSLAMCLYNYRNIEKVLVKEMDQKMAKAGYISIGWFLGCVFMLIGLIFAKFEIDSIQNNSKEAMGYLGWMFLFLLVTMSELFYEQFRVKRIVEASKCYRPGIFFWLSTIGATGILTLIFFS